MGAVLNEKCFEDFLRLIHQLTGITIAKNRTSMIEGRLRKRLGSLNLGSYEDYLKRVQSDQTEQILFIDLVTTNETSFFRTPRIWDYLENKFFPAWLAANPKRVFTAWSAAASSGEEVHSLGILCQTIKEKNSGFLYQILGTDISAEMVELCRSGTFSGKSIDSFRKTRPKLFEKYLQSEGGNFRVSQDIKTRLKFHQHNLFRPLPSSEKFDLILVRNVLIYFTSADQERALALLAPRLTGDGVLIIGESESLSHIQTPYRAVEPLIYRLNPAGNPPAKAG